MSAGILYIPADYLSSIQYSVILKLHTELLSVVSSHNQKINGSDIIHLKADG